MSGSAINRGGVRFEYLPDTGNEAYQWWARMRSHSGHGRSMEDAADALVADVMVELAAAQAARATLRQDAETEPKP